MTNEEAIRFGECILMVADDKSDSTTIEFTKLAIKALETIPKYKDAYNKGWDDGAKATYEHLKMCEEETETGHCKDCKYFEYDSVAKVDGIPLIVAHEICSRWGNGCKTKEDGYCFLFEPQERSYKE